MLIVSFVRSFVRTYVLVTTVNLWGFERNTRESLERGGSYFHPLFIRGRKDLCQEMGRQKLKPDSTPSFYAGSEITTLHPPAAVSLEVEGSPINSDISSSNGSDDAAYNYGASQWLATVIAAASTARQQQQQQQQNSLLALQALWLNPASVAFPSSTTNSSSCSSQLNALAALLNALGQQQQQPPKQSFSSDLISSSLLLSGQKNYNTTTSSSRIDALQVHASSSSSNKPASNMIMGTMMMHILLVHTTTTLFSR